jgi:DNA-binding HxlR family transcriptional regulator
VVTKRADVLDPNCPSRLVLDRIAEKWTGLVVIALADGTLRFGELRERVGGVTAKVLTQTLRSLERDGLVTRRVFAEVPPRVEYTLTATGRSLCDPIATVHAWAEKHAAAIMSARARSLVREAEAVSRPSRRR